MAGLEAKPNRVTARETNNSHPLARENFGTGSAGESAYKAINSVEKCDFKYEPCENPPTHTLDFDMYGQLDHAVLCDTHDAPARERIRHETASYGRNVSFGVNGWGRA